MLSTVLSWLLVICALLGILITIGLFVWTLVPNKFNDMDFSKVTENSEKISESEQVFKPILVLLAMLVSCSTNEVKCGSNLGVEDLARSITDFKSLSQCTKQQHCLIDEVCVPLRTPDSVVTFCVLKNDRSTLRLGASCKENKECPSFYCVQNRCLNLCAKDADCSIGTFCKLVRVQVQDFSAIVDSCLPYQLFLSIIVI